MNSLRRSLSCGLMIVFAGCASYTGAGLKPGVATEAEVRQVMGRPAAVRDESAGEHVWEYAHGPLGLHTYLVRFDNRGTLKSIEQVLDDDHIARIRPGTMNTEEVRGLIGPPYRTIEFTRRGQTSWDYRYEDSFGYRTQLSIVFDNTGVVNQVVRVREEPRESSK